MSAAAPTPLDWRCMPLHGRTLIEASAGTGKTWNIGLIYLRLLLERKLRVEQILVTTFTDAAAQELRERLRRRLIEAERLLTSPLDPTADPSSLQSYLAALCSAEGDSQQALRRLQLARADLDRAPVSTIHALCQRIQRDYPLESGAAFASDKLFDEQQLMRECVEDFWRRRYLVGEVDPVEADLLLKDGPEGMLRDLGGLVNSADARIEAGGLEELQRQLAALQTEGAVVELQRLADDPSFYKRSNAALRTRLQKIAPALRDGDESALAKLLDDTFEADNLPTQESSQRPGELAGHPLIRALQTLRPLLGLRELFVRGAVLAAAASHCREELPRRARARHVQTFSMLIDAVHERLCGPQADAALADRLYEAFPVALIDEFQDTDQRQFAIFDRIYRERGTLVMIGDPKQAIYSFRGGDIAAYLRASARADQHFSLGTNYRSSAALVAAMNDLYWHVDGGFDHPHIQYQQVLPGPDADDKPYTIDGKPASRPLVLHLFRGDALDRKRAPLKSLGELEALALDDCANRIAALLNDPQQQIGERRVLPGDVAVLLSTNNQIAALRWRLIARGVPCVGSGRGNIFAGDAARELQLILHAVLHPDDDRAVRGALATRLLGARLQQFANWDSAPAAFEAELERFAAWRELARTRGVLALVEALLARRATVLLGLSDGERMLTDLRHLGELLAAEASERQGLDGLYAWLQEMRREGSDGDAEAADERQLRIESDAHRVQLLTVHASKGLEFPIVFVPLAWRIFDRKGLHAPRLLRYHDGDGQRCVDLGSADFIAHRAQHFHEELQERLRLLYVALTRAVHAVHIYWVDRCLPELDDEHAWEWAAIDGLITQVQQSLELSGGETSLKAMTDAISGMRLIEPFSQRFVRYAPPIEPASPRATRAPLPQTRPFQWLHSFSGLTRHAAVVTLDAGAADEAGADESSIVAEPAAEQAEHAELLVLYPLRGPRFGNAVHHVLEHARPGAVWPGQRQLVQTQLEAEAIKVAALPPDVAIERVGQMIDRVRKADLGDNLRLADISADQRITEFEFQLPVQEVALSELRRICIAHGEHDVIPASLDRTTLNGMLTGFADLIVSHGDRFHVLDYKTNWLGARLDDYRGDALDAAMAQHHYPLQALLYTVALHRYLRQRMDGYAADRHLGDTCYLFVRATGLGPALGVWRHRWSASLIEALDDAFAGDAGAAT